VKITLKNLQTKTTLRPALISKAARLALFAQGLSDAPGQLNLCFAGDKLVRRLNLKYHSRNQTTDVLAFDIRRGPRDHFLADIIISADTAKRNAERFHTRVDYELCLYAVHGILHLAGNSDRSAAQKKIMQRKAEAILKKVIRMPGAA